MGYANPELYVVWTSQDEPVADYDIRSIDTNGQPRWVELESTPGVGGRFEWPRREFKKALREGTATSCGAFIVLPIKNSWQSASPAHRACWGATDHA
ncbi:DUF3883 domain-containing protein [Pseudomonas sp. 1176_21]